MKFSFGAVAVVFAAMFSSAIAETEFCTAQQGTDCMNHCANQGSTGYDCHPGPKCYCA
ncbi:hypothetical protein PZA11_007400 [Diplocarpon coronariae]